MTSLQVFHGDSYTHPRLSRAKASPLNLQASGQNAPLSPPGSPQYGFGAQPTNSGDGSTKAGDAAAEKGEHGVSRFLSPGVRGLKELQCRNALCGARIWHGEDRVRPFVMPRQISWQATTRATLRATVLMQRSCMCSVVSRLLDRQSLTGTVEDSSHEKSVACLHTQAAQDRTCRA